jgi:hypothetical protein
MSPSRTADAGRTLGGASDFPVAVMGSLASFDLMLAEQLASLGVRASVIRHVDEGDDSFGGSPAGIPIHRYRSGVQLLRLLRGYRFVFTYTAQIGFALGKALRAYPVLTRLGWPNYMNIGTGSDFMERAAAEGRGGAIQRRTMRNAFVNVVPNYPDALRAAAELRLRNACVIPYAYPAPDQAAAAAQPAPEAFARRSPEELLLFHPSHLDWGRTDAGLRRVSTKGNDRFLRALADFTRESERPVRAVILDRGADRQEARSMVAELDLEGSVTFVPPMGRPELHAGILQSDLVVDQFDVGGLGGISWESMSLGRPVMIYLHPNCDLLNFDDPAPVINVRSADEILDALRKASDPAWLSERATETRSWIARRSPAAPLVRYLMYALLATGEAPVDFGWTR